MLAVTYNNNARVAALTVVTLVPLYLLSYEFRIRSSPAASPPLLHDAGRPTNRDGFIEDWLNVQVGDPSSGSAITQLCNQSSIEWRPNLVLNLDDANGGIGNVRGNILDFLFFAIHVGASIILPSFAKRSDTDLSSLWNGKTPFDTFFDSSFFISTLSAKCPQMAIYLPQKESDMAAPLPVRYQPRSMRADIEAERTMKAAVADFDTWLSAQNADLSNITLVNLGRTLWQGPDTRSLPASIRRDFGGLLRLHPSVRQLAAAATFNLAQRFSLPLDARRPYYPQAFLGAHLRTELDAVAAGWDRAGPFANFSGQTDTYMAQAVEEGLGVVYVATGSPSNLSRFTDILWAKKKLNVTSKLDLLEGRDREALEKLSWDQQALVDYEILERASSFAGFVKSSFAFNIAIKRGVVAEMEGWCQEELRWNPEKRKRGEDLAFEDHLSKIWGRDELHEQLIPRGAWP